MVFLFYKTGIITLTWKDKMRPCKWLIATMDPSVTYTLTFKYSTFEGMYVFVLQNTFGQCMGGTIDGLEDAKRRIRWYNHVITEVLEIPNSKG